MEKFKWLDELVGTLKEEEVERSGKREEIFKELKKVTISGRDRHEYGENAVVTLVYKDGGEKVFEIIPEVEMEFNVTS